MEKASRHFLGIHDFSNFARVRDKNPLRNILAIRIAEEDGFRVSRSDRGEFPVAPGAVHGDSPSPRGRW